ncbi:Growth hormone-releasing hormone receptor [Triplophysa tibetana]|uniref:Growth hormone-releasing hormone receptor n=1 Tax=Triplophysa tibetana TaxID=1572043 RepID=A0A5A9N8V0_9TELE|nr:Growth hormone-releasing hormone receptor [Triplophysa tibetana]KAA0706650.1 Growth hormone-releasing hormone receptor [Triplophysa tibetana]
MQVLSSLHPECEYIFQLARDEQQCLSEITEHGNLSGSGTVGRNCTAGGWSQPFPLYHEACIVEDDITEDSYFATVKLIYTIGYGTSLLSLSVAVVILLLLRRLHCARNYIHMQLFLTFILKSVSVFIKDATLFASDDTDHCTLSTAACKASVVFCHYCVMCNFFWLLVEAVYLNSLLVSTFLRMRRCLWSFALLGWGVPLVCIVLWICSRLFFEDTERLTKSTLLLIPLFGTHYMVFSFLPDYFNVSLRICVELCLGSFQGLIVAVLYCFLNQEVQNEIRLRWIRYQEGSYAVVPVGVKGSQMDTPF